MSIEGAYNHRQYIEEFANMSLTEKDFWIRNTLTDSKVNLIVPENLVIENFARVIAKYRIRYTLNNEEFFKYKFNPSRLSKHIYGTTEYAWLILFANEMTSVTEFNKRDIYIYNKAVIDVLNEILNVTADEKDKNDAEIFNFKKEINIAEAK